MVQDFQRSAGFVGKPLEPMGNRFGRSSVGFTWEGFDEMDEVRGEGPAELLDDGSIKIEFAYHDSDEAVLKAKRETSSTPKPGS